MRRRLRAWHLVTGVLVLVAILVYARSVSSAVFAFERKWQLIAIKENSDGCTRFYVTSLSVESVKRDVEIEIGHGGYQVMWEHMFVFESDGQEGAVSVLIDEMPLLERIVNQKGVAHKYPGADVDVSVRRPECSLYDRWMLFWGDYEFPL